MTYSRDIYLNSAGGKTSQSDKIGKKYLEVIRQIGQMYNSAAEEIKNQYRLQRSQLSAQSKISKANTSSQLAQKGLSKSGESIQSSMLSDMAYMGALTSLGNDEASKLNQLASQHSAAMSSVHKDMLNAQNEAERQEAEMEYQKERDAESDRRWNTQHLYDLNRDIIEDDRAERAISRDIYENDRDYNFDMQKYQDSKNQQSFENNLSQRELDMKSSQIQNENYIKSQYLALEREKQNYDMTHDNSDTSEDENYEFGYALNSQGLIVPDVSPDKFLDNMLKGKGTNALTKKYIIPDDISQRVQQIIEDERIEKSYRELLEICARSRGIIE